jgi:hypothetical protein
MIGSRTPGVKRKPLPEGRCPVTEAEWLACTDPYPTVRAVVDLVSERRLRLFVCACVRRLLDLDAAPECRRAVEVAERFADGLASEQELQAADRAMLTHTEPGAHAPAQPDTYYAYRSLPFFSVRAATHPRASHAAEVVANPRLPLEPGPVWPRPADQAEARRQRRPVIVELLREEVGNPSRRLKVPPAWLAANEATAQRLAQGIWEEQDFERLPILGDALEDAGCANAAILDHCRRQGGHVRGCWVLDLLLGKDPLLGK